MSMQMDISQESYEKPPAELPLITYGHLPSLHIDNDIQFQVYSELSV